jgi:hypothetical protein
MGWWGGEGETERERKNKIERGLVHDDAFIARALPELENGFM